jgi:hypothetical protein
MDETPNVGDRVRRGTVEYTVEAVYVSENGGWELRLRTDAGAPAWLDAEDVELVTDPVVDDDGQEDLFGA